MDESSINVFSSPITEAFPSSISSVNLCLSSARNLSEDTMSLHSMIQERSEADTEEICEEKGMEHVTAFDLQMLDKEEDEKDQQSYQEQNTERGTSLDHTKTPKDEYSKNDGIQRLDAHLPRLRLRSPRKRQRRIQRKSQSPRQSARPLTTHTPHNIDLTDGPFTSRTKSDGGATKSTTGLPVPGPVPTIASRRRVRNPAFQATIRHLSLKLAPLVKVSTGQPHPGFPKTMLAFHLLTDAQLEDLASYYHQRTPSPWSQLYPCPVNWEEAVTTDDKRRKFGKFIGLRGCESHTAIVQRPTTEAVPYVPTIEEIQEAARQAAIIAEMEAVRRGSKGI